MPWITAREVRRIPRQPRSPADPGAGRTADLRRQAPGPGFLLLPRARRHETPGLLRASYVEQTEALDHVAGYCVVNDVSEREYQIERGGTWGKGKGCDTFGPTLLPGDIVTTGTPPGVGMGIKPEPIFLKPGDVMTLGIEGLGEQRQEVIAWQRSGGGPSNGL